MINLITGGSGFLGSQLTEAMVARGEIVRALVRPLSNTSLLENLGVELIRGDLTDPSSLKKAVQGVERVYHCAALAADWGPWKDFRAANVTGVYNILEAAMEAGVDKIIHVSTTDVYGHPNRYVRESAPYRSRGWPYGDTKIEGEKIVWDYHREHDLSITIVRPVSIYGPRSVTFVIEII